MFSVYWLVWVFGWLIFFWSGGIDWKWLWFINCIWFNDWIKGGNFIELLLLLGVVCELKWNWDWDFCWEDCVVGLSVICGNWVWLLVVRWVGDLVVWGWFVVCYYVVWGCGVGVGIWVGVVVCWGGGVWWCVSGMVCVDCDY